MNAVSSIAWKLFTFQTCIKHRNARIQEIKKKKNDCVFPVCRRLFRVHAISFLVQRNHQEFIWVIRETYYIEVEKNCRYLFKWSFHDRKLPTGIIILFSNLFHLVPKQKIMNNLSNFESSIEISKQICPVFSCGNIDRQISSAKSLMKLLLSNLCTNVYEHF